MFDAQACFARDYILGKVDIKEENDRAADNKLCGERFSKLKDGHDDIDYQRDYVADLFKVGQIFDKSVCYLVIISSFIVEVLLFIFISFYICIFS